MSNEIQNRMKTPIIAFIGYFFGSVCKTNVNSYEMIRTCFSSVKFFAPQNLVSILIMQIGIISPNLGGKWE